MGAYDNPKSYTTVDYTAGTKAFNTTFQTGLAAGIAEGDKLIADRKKYEDTVYAQGEEMKKELSAAVDNGEKTKEQINTALEEFYAEALNVEQPTKKGLGGLFSMPTENRMDQKGMREAQNSFEGAVTPINTVLDYIYTSDMDIDENNDKGHGLYSDKKNIYNAIKNGDAKPSFKYDNQTKKFTSFIEVGGRKYTEAELQTIFTASGKEQRDIIDGEHDTLLEGLSSRTSDELKNFIAERKQRGFTSGRADAADYAMENVFEQFGLDEKGEADPEKFTRNKLGVANNIYNNKLDLNEDLKKQMLDDEVSGFNLTGPQKDTLLDLPLNVGPKEIEKKLGVDAKTAEDLFEKSKTAKLKMVSKYTFNKMEEDGLLDEFYRKEPKQTNTGGGGGSGSGTDQSKLYPQQMMSRTFDISSDIQDIIANPGDNFSSNREQTEGGEFKGSFKDYNLAGINEISDGGVVRSVESSNINAEGVLTLSFQPKSKIVSGIDKNSKEYKDLIGDPEYATKTEDEKNTALMNLPNAVMEQGPQKSLKFDMFDPYDLEKFYKRLQGKESELNESTKSQAYKTYFDQQFFVKYLQNPSRLSDPRMTKFRPYVVNKYAQSQGLSKKQAIQSLTKNYPQLASMDWFKREALKL